MVGGDEGVDGKVPAFFKLNIAAWELKRSFGIG
jgi:hypothetical protein